MRYPLPKRTRRFVVYVYTPTPVLARRALCIALWPEPIEERWASDRVTTRIEYRVNATSADEIMTLLHNVDDVLAAVCSPPVDV